MTHLRDQMVKESDLSSEEAGDPVPEVRLAGAAQEPETPPQIFHSQRTTCYDGIRPLRVPENPLRRLLTAGVCLTSL